MVTSAAREDELRPVRVTPSRGLISYFYIRVRKEDVGRYSDIKTLIELTQLSVLQGTNWATIPGLEAAGFEVKLGQDACSQTR
ncbi:hypothetical protein N9383_05195 [Granulosicoccus sp.]|nr:hypothetical protein [Granulosicoccus sp.]